MIPGGITIVLDLGATRVQCVVRRSGATWVHAHVPDLDVEITAPLSRVVQRGWPAGTGPRTGDLVRRFHSDQWERYSADEAHIYGDQLGAVEMRRPRLDEVIAAMGEVVNYLAETKWDGLLTLEVACGGMCVTLIHRRSGWSFAWSTTEFERLEDLLMTIEIS